jgi:ectonucleotide pyrophosphatase/phosphodiesterase family protein 5
MHPVFVAAGPVFKKNYTKRSEMLSVDVYLLMCFILDLEPAVNDGTLKNIVDLIDESCIDREITTFMPPIK